MFHLCCVAIFLVSAAGRIQGTVTDEQTGLAIPNANIMVQGTTIGTATDGDGSFFILNVPSGTYTVEVSFIGYQTKRIIDVVVEYDKTARLDVSLQPAAVEIAPVDVTSERSGVSKEMVGTTYVVGKDEISSLPVDRTTDLIAFQAAVARTDTALHVRGGRPTEVQYMIDDVSIIDPLTGNVAINISKGIIDEVIFLPGGFNAEYGRAMSGIINMITSHPGTGMSAEVRGKTEYIMPMTVTSVTAMSAHRSLCRSAAGSQGTWRSTSCTRMTGIRDSRSCRTRSATIILSTGSVSMTRRPRSN